ncbi:glyoxalase/bleomycin resistance/extradiol dioxygenase family protein [Flavobacterium sp. ANB]|uniref:VOC family protein n=1 Tax=unclassified Flavobacterium TaxID=196869 RepID=UPI0012B78300|nr:MULTISPECIES: glyoxalase/bleomycin resistance/extradiol dioxygenase family protein [unclassified Flavobacterium]MBF4516678.1 glyoxalase/bleomycin resistance/extradiol dioxygenase family protein [Flavobacterium sp. ANB]MTD69426.1 glyoxalase/bleomycin resistance/extradiol dioxygenase family protein [Flavobacterium sp. LC2016-13]
MKQIFINLPVENIENSMNFYLQLGFTNKPLFSDDHQKCMIWSEEISVMPMSHEKFAGYSKKAIPDTKTVMGAYYTLHVESVDRINEIIDLGLKAGGKEPIEMIDEGFMQLRRIEDLDGHTWDFIFMDLSKFQKE